MSFVEPRKGRSVVGKRGVMATIRKHGNWIGSCPDCGNTNIREWEGMYACDECATAFEIDEIVWVKESESDT